MARHQNATRAILVLEAPWEIDSEDSNRTSVLPFVDGVAKLAGDTEVYLANFYDKSSFGKALDCLCKTKFLNTIVYIAAHGYKDKVQGIKLLDALSAVASKSRAYNITGVLLGSCYVGENVTAMQACIEDSNLRWCVGYSSASYWLSGTMIDTAILAKMSQLDNDDFKSRDLIVEHFAEALSPFSLTFPIGEDYERSQVQLQDSIRFVVQPSGQGKQSKDVSADVFREYKNFQVIEDDA
ncbi:hypothetical protein ACRN98_17830 [Shewanella oncorhynchi]|uniref:hypothetical protein n=1 Tax=Shewanella TaxID=22 RepID=UPI0021D88FD9|nr:MULTISPECIES: hypothetical protein [unclassified Shewanella]MCU8040424.1 hypothetical protein [Shewanella sp. SM69]MCU8045672.1 hypothetical protein [Shewanella sp. SM68]MCU8049999.1 hypothetical protein [Shewanella sp. SM65]MCU8072459.1 hypothetical protein [Shewanella sp. SM32]MCU8090174.1 hypothetical protein [Shewanella sp. SM20]